MNRTSPSEIKSWCIERGFHPNKTLGQNFLIDRNILEAIVDLAGDIKGRLILEVGPGLGVMTEELLRRGAQLTAVEKDVRLAEELRATLGVEYPETLRLIASDFLELNLDELLSPPFNALVANLPYSVGTRILLDVLLHAAAPQLAVVLVQTEVAERLAAREGDDARGQAGVWAQLDYDVRVARKVKPSCFWPRPAVDSSVVVLAQRPMENPLTPAERQHFFALTKFAFTYRRKQLGSLLRKSPTYGSTYEALLADADLAATIRPEDVSQAQWIAMAKYLAVALPAAE